MACNDLWAASSSIGELECFQRADTAITEFFQTAPLNDNEWHRHPSLAPWRAARTALMDDPDAPLPPVCLRPRGIMKPASDALRRWHLR
jgi:hypothetical protein